MSSYVTAFFGGVLVASALILWQQKSNLSKGAQGTEIHGFSGCAHPRKRKRAR